MLGTSSGTSSTLSTNNCWFLEQGTLSLLSCTWSRGNGLDDDLNYELLSQPGCPRHQNLSCHTALIQKTCICTHALNNSNYGRYLFCPLCEVPATGTRPHVTLPVFPSWLGWSALVTRYCDTVLTLTRVMTCLCTGTAWNAAFTPRRCLPAENDTGFGKRCSKTNRIQLYH